MSHQNESFAGERRLRELIEKCSNWGRWGSSDQRGALNYVTPEATRAALRTVELGRSLSLSLPLDESCPQTHGRRKNPSLLMLATGTDHLAGAQYNSTGRPIPAQFGIGDDAFSMATQSGTHVDALSHIFWEGKMYNGYSAGSVDTRGAHCCDASSLGVVSGRAVLLDVASHRGCSSLPPGFAISTDDLCGAAERQGSTIGVGDLVLVRTGFLGERRGAWGDYCGGPSPGLSLDTAEWLFSQKVSLVASDTWGVEVMPNEIDMFEPLHVVSLVHSGIPFGENFVLDELASECAALGRYEFFISLSPLPLTGACGSPVNPVVIL